jgi:KAP family P-loop domain/TIR domain
MESAEVSRPQVVIISPNRNRERILPLYEGLRDRGVQVWWDWKDLLPASKWESEIQEIVSTTPITCVVISEESLSSANFFKVLEFALAHQRQVVPIRLDPIGRERLPKEIVDRIWVDLLSPQDLDRACEQILRVVRTFESPASSSEKAPSQEAPKKRPSVSAKKTEEKPALDLLFGDARAPETWPMTDELRTMLESAARYRRDDDNEKRFPLSFRTTLMALFYAGGTWSQWAIGLAKDTDFDRMGLGAIPVSPLPVSTPLRTTSSIATLLQTAREYAKQANTTLDIHHVIAAAIFTPNWHEADLERQHFDKLAWANALVQETVSRYPLDAEVFRGLRDAAFPVTKAPPEMNAPNAPPIETTPSTDLWSLADSDLRKSLLWAAATATARTKGPGPLSVRELFAGIVRGTNETALVDAVASTMPEAGSNVDEPVWGRVYRKLGLPSISGAPDLGELPPRDATVDQVLAKAIAIRPQGSDSLTCALVFLAMFKPDVAGDSAAVDPVLNDLGVDAEKVLEKLQQEFEAGHHPAATRVGEIIELRRTYRAWERPHVDNDFVEGAIPPDRDLLDARKPALRFAKLLAARDVPPPIALGLFGNWGSGKTFFMGLMRDRIQDLSKNGGNGYVRRVVQIEFNAWHYHDTNLWASLALRIFEGLAKELGGKQPSEVEKKRKELHQKIRSSAARRSEAEEQRDQALGRRTDAAKELEALRAQREKHRSESIRIQLQAAWRVVTTKERYQHLQGIAKDLSKHFGIDKAVESIDQVRQLKRDVEDTRTHALGIFTAIGRRFNFFVAVPRTVAALAFAILAALALGWGVEWLDKLKELRLPQFSGTLVQVATLVTTVTAWCGCRVRELRGALDTIGAVEAELAEEEKKGISAESKAELEKISALEAQIASLDQDIHKKSEELSAAEREIAEATAEIERINRGGLVYDFLQERTAAPSYIGQLGLISTIRQDLERLDELLQDFVTSGENPIERIVLYVDDLDRCHPNKVVEVLQAVHLLLAFDLFNVVVGVDARWLERSLYRQYVGEANDGLPRPNDPFSPQDYLEKIFQIPYALAPMDQTAFKNLVGGMIETRTEWKEKEREKLRQKELEEANAAAKLKLQEQGNAGDADAGSKEAERGTEARSQADTSESDTAQVKQDTAPADGSATSSEAVLFFEDHEEEFIACLYAFIDRPRLAKRFINIYRLLRVRADDEGESSIFAARASASDFRAALVLLAIHVGHPTVAAKVTQAIETAKKSLQWPALMAQLAAGKCDSVTCTTSEREEIAAIVNKLEAIGAPVPTELDSYCRWAPRVGCFSFDWHRVSPRRRPFAGQTHS